MKFRNLASMAYAVLSISIITVSPLAARQPAFPTAEGSGRFATGGRFGEVYEVTNLNNSGPGSIVDAVSEGNRTIVFRVSGTIEMGDVNLKPKANTTIAGQTAPGDGICIKGHIDIEASNIIIRYLRVRVDRGAANRNGDAVGISDGIKNVIVDHLSCSYARDETLSCYADSATVQWCILSEALTFEGHSMGSLIRGSYGDQITYHHNLYAHTTKRQPRPGNTVEFPTDTVGLFLDWRNNVIYNWGERRVGYNDDNSHKSSYNFVGNVYIEGPDSPSSNIFRDRSPYNTGYFADNSYNDVVPADPWSLVEWRSNYTAEMIADYKARAIEIPMEPVTTTSPAQAKIDVLAIAGASLPKRDIIDTRIVNDVWNKTGHSIADTSEQPEGGWPALNSLPAPTDDDHDGMPNEWEIAQGLNKDDPEDRNTIGQDGYTMLEVYLNSLTGEMSPVSSVDGFTSDHPKEFALHQNYPNPFNPETTIRFTISQKSGISLKIHNMAGQEIATLADSEYPSGTFDVRWNGNDSSGNKVPSGIYIYRLEAKGVVISNKMLLVK